VADDTSKLKPRPEFGPGVFEGPPGPGGAKITTEPEPGTPEFGARAKQRALNQSPDALTARSGLTPTPEEIAAVTPDLNPEPSDTLVGAQPGALPGDVSAMMKMFDVPVPSLDALLNDPTPVNTADPEGDIISRLADSILGDQTEIPQPRGFTPGEHLALGIMGALDGEVFQSVVLPMLQQEREAPRQAALDMEAQKQRRIAALQVLATLMTSRRQHEATMALTERGQNIDIARMRQDAMEQNANRRTQLLLAQMRERSRTGAQTKVGDRVLATYTLANIAFQNALKMKRLMDNNPGIGGIVAGSETISRLGLRSDAASEMSSLGGTVNEAVLMINQRRGLNKESMKKLGDSLFDIKMSPKQQKAAVENVLREYGMYMAGSERMFPQLRGVKMQLNQLVTASHDDPEALKGILLDPESWLNGSGFSDTIYPGFENGDKDLRLFRDDSEVP
jgi:hypothetical protein